jgi:hypothetical protein
LLKCLRDYQWITGLYRMLHRFGLKLARKHGPRSACENELVDRVMVEVPISIHGEMVRQLRNPCRLA